MRRLCAEFAEEVSADLGGDVVLRCGAGGDERAQGDVLVDAAAGGCLDVAYRRVESVGGFGGEVVRPAGHAGGLRAAGSFRPGRLAGGRRRLRRRVCQGLSGIPGHHGSVRCAQPVVRVRAVGVAVRRLVWLTQGNALAQVGDPEAIAQLTAALARLPQTWVRSRAALLVDLARAHAASGDRDAAVAHARSARQLAQQIHSNRHLRRLAALVLPPGRRAA